MWFDILFFAVVAIVLLLRLRSVLGQTDGQERRQRPNPFEAAPPAPPSASSGQDAARPDLRVISNDADDTPEPANKAFVPPVFKEAPDSLAGRIERIQSQDPSFTEKGFLQGARSAFEIILKAFADEDTNTLHQLLGDDVYDSFTAAIRARQAAKEKLSITVSKIKDAEIEDAKLELNTARVVVRFVSEQIQFTRNASGSTISGDAVRAQTLTDIWTFARNTHGNDPVWRLTETRSE